MVFILRRKVLVLIIDPQHILHLKLLVVHEFATFG